jgi:hypothetical protein
VLTSGIGHPKYAKRGARMERERNESCRKVVESKPAIAR